MRDEKMSEVMTTQATIDLLVTVDDHYVKPLKVLLFSIKQTNPGQHFDIWLLHANITPSVLQALATFVDQLGFNLHAIKVPLAAWAEAPTAKFKQYPPEMYFRLLCGDYLPDTLHRVIYLDPDILVINPIKPLFDMPLAGHMLAAASHMGLTGITQTINHVRLGTRQAYFNSGVMLMDLDKMRQRVRLQDIFDVIASRGRELILPDQDILNYLYGADILPIPEEVWNYDTRDNIVHYAKSFGEVDMQWVMKNTVILHFCGRPKPWEKSIINRYAVLYQHYEQLLVNTQFE
ncbi:glycosyltransferase family 8 protein [Leuconostoc lactis]